MKAMETKLGQSVVIVRGPLGTVYARAGEIGRVVVAGSQVHTSEGPKLLSQHADVELTNLPVEFTVQSAIRRNGLNLVGGDPEVFVEAGGVVIPAWSFLPDKAHRWGDCFWDGVQAEFVFPPRSCHEIVVYDIYNRLNTVRDLARKVNPKAKLSSKCVFDLPDSILESATDEQIALGCAPSLNVYGETPLAVDGRLVPIRSAGCHIHQGLGPMDETVAAPIVKAMDALAGVCMTAALEGLEDPRRRQLYGKAGEYRLPVHGLEYRVLSSSVLASPTLTYLAFDLARAGAHIGLLGLSVWDNEPDDRVRHIINNLDVGEARKLLTKHRTRLTDILRKVYPYSPGPANARKLIQNGAINLIDTDINHTWYKSDGRVADIRL